MHVHNARDENNKNLLKLSSLYYVVFLFNYMIFFLKVMHEILSLRRRWRNESNGTF